VLGVAPPTPIVVDAVTRVPSVVNPEMPPKAPPLLYCTWVVDPPGDPPPPAGVAQDPSPRQNVVLEAPVPLFKLVTGKLPVTSAVKLTAPNVGAPAALPCSTVVVVPRLASGAGAAPAPPPTIRAYCVNAPELAQVEALEKYGIPPDVPAMVNAGVVVAVATDTMPPVQPTEVTVPVPPDVQVGLAPEPWLVRN